MNRVTSSASIETPRIADFDGAVRAAVMQAGGWNSTSRQRVAALAVSMGRTDADIRRALSLIGSRGQSMNAGAAAGVGAVNADQAASAGVSAPRSDNGAITGRAAVAPSPRRRVRGGSHPVLTGLALVVMVAGVFVMTRALALKQGTRTRPEAVALPQESVPISEASTAAVGASGGAPAQEMDVRLPGAETAAPKPVVEPGPRVAVDAPKAVERRTGGVLSRWEAAALALRDEPIGADPVKALTHAARLARLDAAVTLAWAGDMTAAEALVEESGSANDPPAPREPEGRGSDLGSRPVEAGSDDEIAPDEDDAQVLTGPGREGDGQLALQIIAARRQPGAAAESLMRRRFAHESLGPVDCDAVAECAMYGSPLEMRLACKKIAIDQRGNAAMVHALIEALPRASAQSHVSEIIAQVSGRSLPSASDAAWPAAARAALVARLSELMSVNEGELDEAARALMLALASAESSVVAATDADAALGDAQAIESHARERWQRWHAAASAQGGESAVLVAVERMARRRDLRLLLASGPMQRFAAWQASTIDAMGFVVGREQPSLASRVEAVVAQGAARVRAAKDAAAQIAEGERTIVRLWLLRAGSPDESSGSKGGAS